MELEQTLEDEELYRPTLSFSSKSYGTFSKHKKPTFSYSRPVKKGSQKPFKGKKSYDPNNNYGAYNAYTPKPEHEEFREKPGYLSEISDVVSKNIEDFKRETGIDLRRVDDPDRIIKEYNERKRYSEGNMGEESYSSVGLEKKDKDNLEYSAYKDGIKRFDHYSDKIASLSCNPDNLLSNEMQTAAYKPLFCRLCR